MVVSTTSVLAIRVQVALVKSSYENDWKSLVTVASRSLQKMVLL